VPGTKIKVEKLILYLVSSPLASGCYSACKIKDSEFSELVAKTLT
jgi:hypothetical protein